MTSKGPPQAAFLMAVFDKVIAMSSQPNSLCHPGLEPGSRAHSSPLQRAAFNTESRVFARDDKHENSTDV